MLFLCQFYLDGKIQAFIVNRMCLLVKAVALTTYRNKKSIHTANTSGKCPQQHCCQATYVGQQYDKSVRNNSFSLLSSEGHVMSPHTTPVVSSPVHSVLALHACQHIQRHPTRTKTCEDILKIY